MISSSIDVNNDGANSRKEAPNDAARSAGPRASSLQLWKIVLGLIAFLVVSWVGNAALMVTAVNNLTKDLKVEDGSLKNTDGGSVSTHNQKTTYSISHDFENNASESRRRLQAGGSVQVAAITCPVVRQAIKSIQDGDNEGVVEMAVGAGFLTASVTANFYHAEVTSGTFGIERIHLDGNLDVAYAVECEEASCNVAGYKCPVLGLAVSDEGREECHTLHTKFQGALPLDQSFIGGRDEKWGQRDTCLKNFRPEFSLRTFIANFHCESSSSCAPARTCATVLCVDENCWSDGGTMSWWSDDFINKAPMCDASAIEKCIQNCQKKCYEQFPFSANACDCFGRERMAACRLDGGASAAAAHSACWGAVGSEAGGVAPVVAAELVLMFELVAG